MFYAFKKGNTTHLNYKSFKKCITISNNNKNTHDIQNIR